MLRRPLLALSRSARVKKTVTSVPAGSAIVARHVAGETSDDALTASARLVSSGLKVSLDFLGEDTLDREQADQSAITSVDLLNALRDADLAADCEVSIKPTALGLALGADGPKIALENAHLVCGAAKNAGSMITVDMEDHTTTDATLEIVTELRKDFPGTGAVLQAYLYRSQTDCRDFAYAGSRIRICKGAYDEPSSVAFRRRSDIDDSYRRCLEILTAGAGYPMIATHDPDMIDFAEPLVARREPGSYEFQMLYGIRPTEQHRLANAGHQMRVYVPFGTDWYGYLVRRLAERPHNLGLFLRSLVSRG